MSGDGGREPLRRSTTRFAVGPSMPQLGEPDIFRTAVTMSAELPIGIPQQDRAGDRTTTPDVR